MKKISNHITKKVADKLEELFKKERPQFEDKWESLKLFIEYGMLSEEKFYDRAAKFVLLKNSEQQSYTMEEYKELTKGSQTDKNGDLIWLYASDRQEQYAHIEAAREKGYDVLVMDGQLDVHWMGLLEQKLEKTRFVRVDSDIIDHIIEKETKSAPELSDKQKETLTEVVKSQLPAIEKTEFAVDFKALGESSKPVQITQNEFSRRMKEMAAMQQQMAFYGEMPDSYQLVLNADHPYIKELIEQSETGEKEELKATVTTEAKLKQMVDLALLAGGC